MKFETIKYEKDGPLAWIARNSSKPGRDGSEAWVLHAGPAWSRERLEDPAGLVIESLTKEFRRLATGADWREPVHADAHRWRTACSAMLGRRRAMAGRYST